LKDTHIEKMDSIRGIAIFLVFSFHLYFTLFPNFQVNTYNSNGILEITSLKLFILNFNPIAQGWVGVELFLVISGFLIHYIYLHSQKPLNKTLFFSKRFWRIYPPYIFVLLFLFINNLDLSWEGAIDLLKHMFLIHNLSNDSIFSINVGFWSIALECQLYLIYPLFLFLIKRFAIQKALGIVFLLSIFLTAIDIIFHINTDVFGTFVFKFWFVWCAGAYLAHCFFNKRKMFGKPFLWLIFFYVMFLVFKMFFIGHKLILIPATLSCLTLIETLLYSNFKPITNRIFKIFSFIGICSYSIYLIHHPYLWNLLKFFNPATDSAFFNYFVQVFSTVTLIIFVSYGLYQILELKSIELGKRFRAKFELDK